LACPFGDTRDAGGARVVQGKARRAGSSSASLRRSEELLEPHIQPGELPRRVRREAALAHEHAHNEYLLDRSRDATKKLGAVRTARTLFKHALRAGSSYFRGFDHQ